MKTTKRILAILLATLIALGAFAVGAGAILQSGISQALSEEDKDEISALRFAIRTPMELAYYKAQAASNGYRAHGLFSGGPDRQRDDETGEEVIVSVEGAVLTAFKAGKTPLAYWNALEAALNPMEMTKVNAQRALIAEYGGDLEDPSFDFEDFMEGLFRGGELEAYFGDYYELEFGAPALQKIAVYDALAAECFKPEAMAILGGFGDTMLLQLVLMEASYNGDLDDEEANELENELYGLTMDYFEELFTQLAAGDWDGAKAVLAELNGVIEDVLAEAGLISDPVRYTLTYSANSGAGGPAARTGIAPGTAVTLAAANPPTRAGYAFAGWSTSSTGAAAVTKVTVNGNTTVFAIWVKILPEKEYFKLWGKETKWEKTFWNWILLIVCFGWIWMYF